MGNFFDTTNNIDVMLEDIITLQKIGIDVKENNYDLNNSNNIIHIKSLFKKIYNSNNTTINKTENNYNILRQIIKKHIKSYNELNSTTINEIYYSNHIVEDIKPILYLVDF